MSTRGAVGVGTPAKWEGYFNHFDSYPTHLGKAAWRSMKAGHHTLAALAADMSRLEKGEVIRSTDGSDTALFIEWVYLYNRGTFYILTSHGTDSGGGYHWREVGHYRLSGPEPNWNALERRA